MDDFKIFELYELTRESSFTSYGDPEMIVGEEEVDDVLCEDNDFAVVMTLQVKEKFVDSEDNLWVRIK
ncbi:hypothetical protein [Stenotrophomonas phage RAS14]